MKKLFSVLLSILILTSLLSVASAAEVEPSVEYFPDGSYSVTVIEDESPGISFFSSSATKSKKKTHYSSSGVAQWYVKVTGTFTYGDGSSECTSASVSAGSYVSIWSIESKSASKSGNKATANVTAEQTRAGDTFNIVTESVTLTCSATGTFS